MANPDIFSGPWLADANKAAAGGATLGGVVGFVLASFWLPLSEYQKIGAIGAYSGGLAATFGVALVSFGRLFQ